MLLQLSEENKDDPLTVLDPEENSPTVKSGSPLKGAQDFTEDNKVSVFKGQSSKGLRAFRIGGFSVGLFAKFS